MLTGRKLPLSLAFAVLAGLAFGAGCNGFFTDPVLQSISLQPPTTSVEAGKTVQMSAWGTYDTESQRKNISSQVTWSIPSSDSGIATINTTGLVTGVGLGSTTITASAQGISGQTSLSVTLANLVSISVSPLTASISSTGAGTQQFHATGTFGDGTSHDITTQVDWASSNTNAATISNASGTQGLATAAALTAQQTTNITATSGNIVSSPLAVLTVNP